MDGVWLTEGETTETASNVFFSLKHMFRFVESERVNVASTN